MVTVRGVQVPVPDCLAPAQISQAPNIYRVRLARYFDALDREIATGIPAEPIDWFAIGDTWNDGHESYSAQAVGDSYAVAARVAHALGIPVRDMEA
jgi:hypothetical protein